MDVRTRLHRTGLPSRRKSHLDRGRAVVVDERLLVGSADLGVRPAAVGWIRDCHDRRPAGVFLMRSAAIQASAIVGAMVLPEGMLGKTEASMTRRFRVPWTRSWPSRTPLPLRMAQVPTLWFAVKPCSVAKRAVAASSMAGPGVCS